MKRFCFNQKGSVFILMAFTIPLLIAFSALAADVGYLYVQRSHLQNIADAAALAGAAKLGSGTSDAQALAETYLEINSSAADAGNVETFTFLEENNTKKIRVDITRPAPLLFMRYFGYDTIDLAVYAIAAYSGSAAGIFEHSIVSAGDGPFYLLGQWGSGSNTFNGPIHVNGQNFQFTSTGSGDFTSNKVDASIKIAAEYYPIHGLDTPANKNAFADNISFNADYIDISENNPVISNYIGNLKKNATELQAGAIGNNRSLSSLGEKVYIRGSFDQNGGVYYLAWEPFYSGSITIIADGSIKLGFNNINNISANTKIILCSLTGDIVINAYQDLKLSALAPKGTITVEGGGATIDGFLIGQSITLGNGGRTYQNSNWAGGGAPKVRLTE
ncbi:hypothetical protein HSX37_18430|uniref:Putative Flp pilus-assembly TadE/G-like n=1 Tax=Dendrosporobacter quercicolus TaxID=146817 RepID=A0A1H0A435_9FIRM|nr:pilus assembly protein TadG-related protein [Dendrosporobacter quercicolus]NSL49998.1 hypothetical protein [Dendrosporobacter quercicolus DSM 1736]SDN28021.1 Putative Flp pilus-assembly TadE/G-like [Dendrosporobacter quercicolus]